MKYTVMIPWLDSPHERRPGVIVVTVEVALDVTDVLAVVVPEVVCEDDTVELAVDVWVEYSQFRKRPSSHESITVFKSTSSNVLHVVLTNPDFPKFWHENTAFTSSSICLFLPFFRKAVTIAFNSFTTLLQLFTFNKATWDPIEWHSNVSFKFGFCPKTVLSSHSPKTSFKIFTVSSHS